MEASHAFEPGSSPGGRNHAFLFGSLVVVFIFVAREPPSKPHHAMRLSLSSVPLGLPLWTSLFAFSRSYGLLHLYPTLQYFCAFILGDS